MATRKKAALILRIPEELRRQLAREAKKANRSLNEEMTQRLQHSLALTDLETKVLATRELQDAMKVLDDAKKTVEQIYKRAPTILDVLDEEKVK